MADSRARNADRTSQALAFETDIKIALAGPYAQNRFSEARGSSLDNWRDDIENAQEACRKAALLRTCPSFSLSDDDQNVELTAETVDEANRVFEAVGDQMDTLIEQCWPAIEATARALIKLRTLTGDDVDALIAECRVAAPVDS